MDRKEPQQELRKHITTLEAQHNRLRDEKKALENRRSGYRADFDRLSQLRSEACKLEALGQSSQREKIERDMKTVSAKITGSDALIVSCRPW